MPFKLGLAYLLQAKRFSDKLTQNCVEWFKNI